MPHFTPEQEDALDEAVARQLYRINGVMAAMFGAGLSDGELRRAHDRIRGGVIQAMQQQDSGMNPDHPGFGEAPRQWSGLLQSGSPIAGPAGRMNADRLYPEALRSTPEALIGGLPNPPSGPF